MAVGFLPTGMFATSRYPLDACDIGAIQTAEAVKTSGTLNSARFRTKTPLNGRKGACAPKQCGAGSM